MVLRKWWALESLQCLKVCASQLVFYRQSPLDSYHLTYEIFQDSKFESIHQDLRVFQHAVADYRQYATDILVNYVEIHSEKVGEPGIIVEIDESKIGKRKFKRGSFC